MWPDINFLALFPWQPDKVVCELCFDESGSLIDKLNLDKESQIYPIANHSTGPTWVKWLLYAETWDTMPMALSQEMPAPEEPEVLGQSSLSPVSHLAPGLFCPVRSSSDEEHLMVLCQQTVAPVLYPPEWTDAIIVLWAWMFWMFS